MKYPKTEELPYDLPIAELDKHLSQDKLLNSVTILLKYLGEKTYFCTKLYVMAEATVQYNAAKYPNFKEYLWYEAHEEELLHQYYGRYIVIKEEQVIGNYGSRKLARQETLKNHKPGTFIIHLCEDKDPRRAPRLTGRQLIYE